MGEQQLQFLFTCSSRSSSWLQDTAARDAAAVCMHHAAFVGVFVAFPHSLSTAPLLTAAAMQGHRKGTIWNSSALRFLQQP
jgi:hypothetical protein